MYVIICVRKEERVTYSFFSFSFLLLLRFFYLTCIFPRAYFTFYKQEGEEQRMTYVVCYSLNIGSCSIIFHGRRFDFLCWYSIHWHAFRFGKHLFGERKKKKIWNSSLAEFLFLHEWFCIYRNSDCVRLTMPHTIQIFLSSWNVDMHTK